MSTKYKYAEFDGVRVIHTVNGTVGSWIPCNTALSEYQEYLAWVAEGNEPELWEPESN